MIYQLITTGLIEKIKPVNKKIFLLSSWCLTLEMEKFLKNKNFQVFSYHWRNKEKFYSDHEYLSNVYETNLDILSNLLNNKHSIKSDDKYWRIIIGSWLRQFSDIVFDRYSQIKYASSNNELFININYCENEELADKNYIDFYEKSKSDIWNKKLIELIWQELKLNCKFCSDKIEKRPNKTSLRINIKRLINFLNFKLSKNNSYVIHNININYKQFLNLNFKLNQISLKSYPLEQKIFSKNIDQLFRNYIKDKLSKNNEFEIILSKLISLYFPKIYLEDFSDNRAYLNKLLPKNPKIIMTTHSYYYDDLFKIWVAEKRVKTQSKYFVNQHGGCIRISKLHQEEEHVIETSDKFISWGWKKKDEEIIDTLPSIQLSKIKVKNKKEGDILIVLATYPRFFYSYYSVPISEDYLFYLQNIERIYKSIYLERSLKIRIRFDREIHGWDSEKRLRKKIPLLKKDNHKLLIDSLKNSKIVICTANSTVFLETLSANYPTLIFLDLNLYQLRNDVISDFSKLVNLKICHFQIESLCTHLKNINEDIDNWWADNELQKIRNSFCNKYAKKSNYCIEEWAKFLKS